MRNIVGSTPRGDDFLQRPSFVKLVYRKLEGQSTLYISAPRRVGKTAILRHLEDHPKEGYEFKFLITQAVSTPIAFYKRLLEATKDFKNVTQSLIDFIEILVNKIHKLDLKLGGIEFNQTDIDYLDKCRNIFTNINTNGIRLVIMIDEFPQTVENIWREHGADEAKKFLYANRELQKIKNDNICMIYTGSIGIQSLCTRLESMDSLNEFSFLELGPLSQLEAKLLCEEILKTANVPFESEAISHLLNIVGWLIPFHIQLSLQELIDEYDHSESIINKDSVDKAILKITHRRNDPYFEHYHNHIKKAFHNGEYKFIMRILNLLSNNDFLTAEEVHRIWSEYDIPVSLENIVSILEYDGYVYIDRSKDENQLRFTSPIIKLWWKKNMI
ncbi:ATP-binding protein [Spirosoma pomorum]